jgi:hypothetical protein
MAKPNATEGLSASGTGESLQSAGPMTAEERRIRPYSI